MTSKPNSEHPIVATSSRIAYNNPWMQVREDTTLQLDGSKGIYGVVEANDSVEICAVDEQKRVCLIYGYSYPMDTWSWSTPGGCRDGDDVLVDAARELQEETGFVADTYEDLGSFVGLRGLVRERTSCVIATGLKASEIVESDDASTISNKKFVSLEEAYDMIREGEIFDCHTVMAIYLLEHWMKQKYGN